MNMLEILETLRSSQINFNNLVQMAPQVGEHPIYKVARMQLDAAVVDLEETSK